MRVDDHNCLFLTKEHADEQNKRLSTGVRLYSDYRKKMAVDTYRDDNMRNCSMTAMLGVVFNRFKFSSIVQLWSEMFLSKREKKTQQPAALPCRRGGENREVSCGGGGRGHLQRRHAFRRLQNDFVKTWHSDLGDPPPPLPPTQDNRETRKGKFLQTLYSNNYNFIQRLV